MKKEISINLKTLETLKIDRSYQLDILNTYIKNCKGTKGSILLSGDRGSGKTTLLQDLENIHKNNKQYKFIWINSIYITNDLKEISLHNLLKILTEELTRKEKRGKKQLEQIKNRLYLSERDLGINSGISGEIASLKNIPEITAKYNSNITEKWLGYSTIELSSRLKDVLDYIEKRFFCKIKEDWLSLCEKYPDKKKIFQLYKFISIIIINLFDKLLLRIGLKKENIIFILDELDNYEGDEDSLYSLLDILKSLKSLFTLSEATFIFVSSPFLYSRINQTTSVYYKIGNQKDWDKFRTLFHNQIYFKRLRKEELREYLGKILTSKNKTLKDSIIDFLSIISYGNLHNLKREINKYSIQEKMAKYILI